MAGDSATDEDLIARARGGSDVAFAALVDRHQQAVRGFLIRVCPVRGDVDDIAQDTFLAAWTSLRLLRTGSEIRPWLLGIAWRKAKSAGRKAVRGRARDRVWSDTQPTEYVARTEHSLALDQAMAQLSIEQRASVALCLGAGLSHTEAAKAMNMPLGTLKSHILRGRARVRDILDVEEVNHD